MSDARENIDKQDNLVAELEAQLVASDAKVVELEKRRRYYRGIEAAYADMCQQRDELADRIDVMQGDYDAAVTQNLEEQTWLRMESAGLRNDVKSWQTEALEWSKLYGALRQVHEHNMRSINTWVTDLRAFAKWGVVMDVMIILLAIVYTQVA